MLVSAFASQSRLTQQPSQPIRITRTNTFRGCPPRVKNTRSSTTQLAVMARGRRSDADQANYEITYEVQLKTV